MKGKAAVKEDDAALLHECLLFGKSNSGQVLSWLCMEESRKPKSLGEHMMHFLRQAARETLYIYTRTTTPL